MPNRICSTLHPLSSILDPRSAILSMQAASRKPLSPTLPASAPYHFRAAIHNDILVLRRHSFRSRRRAVQPHRGRMHRPKPRKIEREPRKHHGVERAIATHDGREQHRNVGPRRRALPLPRVRLRARVRVD
eukprot:1812992-Rhodomonas_salina.2